MRYFYPTIYVNKVTDIDNGLLQKHKVKAVLLDIDNTLSPHNTNKPFDGVKKWLDEIKKAKISLLILTNRSNIQSVDSFAKKLNLEYVANAKKPFQAGFNRAISILNLPRESILLVGDQMFTDILGANIAGIKSALVAPQDERESLFIKIKRFFEVPFRIAIRYSKKKGTLKNEKNFGFAGAKFKYGRSTRACYLRQRDRREN